MENSGLKPNRNQSPPKFQAFSVTLVGLLVVCFGVTGIASTAFDVHHIPQVNVIRGNFDGRCTYGPMTPSATEATANTSGPSGKTSLGQIIGTEELSFKEVLAEKRLCLAQLPNALARYTLKPSTSQATSSDSNQLSKKVMKKVVSSNNKFAFDLYSQLAKRNENIFFSPLSISTALSMTYEGAKRETAEQIRSVLHLPQNDDVRRSFYREMSSWIKEDQKYQLEIANGLWAQEGFGLLEDYLEINRNVYGAEIGNLDFFNNALKAISKINDWVKSNTDNKIKRLISEKMINKQTKMVLTNAIYFKGRWLKQFRKTLTQRKYFRVNNNKKVKVPMMRLTGEKAVFNYAETDNLKALKLPYKGKNLSMFILLPKKGLELDELENNLLTTDFVKTIEENMSKQRVNVSFPRFDLKTSYSLKKSLKDMGMKKPFSQSADFSGISGKEGLFIQFVTHKTYISIDEEGTESTAATGVGMKGIFSPHYTKFVADHPFLFVIKHERTGLITFMGKVTNPKEL